MTLYFSLKFQLFATTSVISSWIQNSHLFVALNCCSTFRSILHTGIWKEKLKVNNGCTSNSDKINYRYEINNGVQYVYVLFACSFLTVRELTDRIQRLQHKYRTLQKSAERLKEKVLKATEENGVTLTKLLTQE